MEVKNLQLKPFIDYRTRISRKISLNPSFSFGIPPTFFKENGLDEGFVAKLFYDELQRVIGIKFVRKSETSGPGFKINVYGEGDKKGATFLARSFFKKYNIDPDKYRGKYDPEKVDLPDVGEVFIFELKENDKLDRVDSDEEEG